MNRFDTSNELIPGLILVCDSPDLLKQMAPILGYEDTAALKEQLETLVLSYVKYCIEHPEKE